MGGGGGYAEKHFEQEISKRCILKNTESGELGVKYFSTS